MTGNIVNQDVDVVGRNPGYVLNNTDSVAKAAIENWFRTNLTNEIDNTKRNYANYIEDTIYCNDRSLKTTGSIKKYEQSGWNSNGGSLSTHLYFGTWNRYDNSWYSASNVPSLACPNEEEQIITQIHHIIYIQEIITGLCHLTILSMMLEDSS